MAAQPGAGGDQPVDVLPQLEALALACASGSPERERLEEVLAFARELQGRSPSLSQVAETRGTSVSRLLAGAFGRMGVKRPVPPIAEPMPLPAGGTHQFGLIAMKVDRRLCLVNGIPTQRLTPIEFSVLLLLVAARGLVVTREQICSTIWGRPEHEMGPSLNQSVTQIRRKLERYAGLLGSDPRVGYYVKETLE